MCGREGEREGECEREGEVGEGGLKKKKMEWRVWMWRVAGEWERGVGVR